MCLSCGWKPGGSNIEDEPLFKYMKDAFDKASAGVTDENELNAEYEDKELAAFGYIGPALSLIHI